MKKIGVIFLVFSVVCLGGALAAVDSIKVSGDITSQVVTRDLSLGASGNSDSEDFLFSQIRLRFDAMLTEGVSGVVQLINERIWGEENGAGTTNNGNSDLDLDLGYIMLKEFFSPSATLIVGRQNLMFGNGLIIADPDTNQGSSNTSVPTAISDITLRKSFDAIRLVLDYSPYVVDLIYAKVYEADTNVDDDVTLFGVNVGYAWNSYDGLTEVYAFGSDNVQGTTSQDEKSKTYVIGARTQFLPTDHWVLGLEGAYQFGDRRSTTPTSAAHLEAWALQAITEYRLLNDVNAKVGASYTFLSGDDNGSSDYEGWDPMFEGQTPAEIMNLLKSHSNAHILSLSGSYMPREDLTIGGLYAKGWLAEKMVGTTSIPVSMGPATTATSSNIAVNPENRSIGDEIDVYAIYDYTEDVQFKATCAVFMPGSWITSANDSTAYSLRGGLSVAF